jgi:hypothetical protein
VINLKVGGGVACGSDCGVGLAMVAVVVERWGEISHHFEDLVEISMGEWYGVPGSSEMAM